MNQKNITNPFILIVVLFILLPGLRLLRAVESSPDPAADLLKKIENDVNTTVRGWQFSIQGKDWKNQRMRAYITQDNFRLKTFIRGVEVFSGVKVKGTPSI